MSSITVRIPTPLRAFSGGAADVDVGGAPVGEALHELVAHHVGLSRQLLNAEGRIRNNVVVYLNDEDVRYLQRDATPIRPGDVLSIVSALAGG